WPLWARLMPHLLAADLAATNSPGLRQLACDAFEYLLSRRDIPTAYDLAIDLRQQWRDRLGDNDEHTLEIARYLGWVLQAMGRWATCQPPATWTRTPWTAGAGSWATTTPTPCAQLPSWPPTCASWARCRLPATWTRTPWTASVRSWARTIPTP